MFSLLLSDLEYLQTFLWIYSEIFTYSDCFIYLTFFSILFYLSSWFFLFSIASFIKFWLLQLILYLKEYDLLCYAIFDINIVKNNWLPHLNQTLPFNDSFVLISALCIYCIRYCLVLSKTNTFPNLLGDWTKVIFLFSKNLQLINQKGNWRVVWLLWHCP